MKQTSYFSYKHQLEYYKRKTLNDKITWTVREAKVDWLSWNISQVDIVFNMGNSKNGNTKCIFAVKGYPKVFYIGIITHRGVSAHTRQIFHIKIHLQVEGPCVYFVKDGQGLVKIGKTKNLKKRMRALATANATLELLGAIPVGSERRAYNLEKELHNKLVEYNKQGEWFQLTPELHNFINLLEGYVKA